MKKTSFKKLGGQPAPASDVDERLEAFVETGSAASVPSATSRQDEKPKRFTFDLPPDLHRRFKAGCAARGVDMGEFLRDFLENSFPS